MQVYINECLIIIFFNFFLMKLPEFDLLSEFGSPLIAEFWVEEKDAGKRNQFVYVTLSVPIECKTRVTER